MTSIRQLVSEAFRENNLTQVGDVPEGTEYVEAEGKLTRFITSLFEAEMGERLKNTSLTSASQVVAPNSRLIISDNMPTSITLREHPNDGEQFAVLDPRGLLNGFTVKAGAGTIENASEVSLDNSSSSYSWFYRADKGNWYKITSLTTNSECPLPEEFDDMLSLWLSMRIAPRMGASTAPESIQLYNNIQKKFVSRYRQVEEVYVENGLLYLTNSDSSGHYLDWAKG